MNPKPLGILVTFAVAIALAGALIAVWALSAAPTGAPAAPGPPSVSPNVPERPMAAHDLPAPDPAAARGRPEPPAGADPLADLRMTVAEASLPAFDAALEAAGQWVPIRSESLANELDRIAVRDADNVSEQQQEALVGVLHDCLLAYKRGVAADILSDLLRGRYTIRPDAAQRHRALLERFYLEEGEALPTDDDGVMRLLVRRHYHGDDGSGFKDLYNELSTDQSHIDFGSTDPMYARLRTMFDTETRRFPNGMVQHEPSIDFVVSPHKVLKEDGRLVYADVWLAATDAEGHRYTRFRRYYWAEPERTWLPMEMISFYANPRKADAFF